MSSNFSPITVYTCIVYFAELAGNYFVTLWHSSKARIRPVEFAKNCGTILPAGAQWVVIA